ncbi:MAG: hypothetical protein RL514_4096 [Verrucomicrobiota bacterium]
MLRTCLGAALLVGAGVATAGAQEAARLDKLEKENADLKQRLENIEALATKEGILPKDKTPNKTLKFLADTEISGFVQASYFYNTARPVDGVSDAYLWNTRNNSISINKIKLSMGSKALATDVWGAGYKVSLMYGDDATQLNSPSAGNTSFNDLREGYLEVNVPIGTGLNIKAGELISLLNYESGDGGAANPNFSQGNQWWFTGNGPSAGIQASYNFTDKVGLTLRVDNGLFQGPVDNNDGKAFSGSLNLKPTAKFWENVYFFLDHQPGGSGTICSGFGTIGGYQVTEKLGTGWEFDYFHFDAPAGKTDLWSIGGWVWYDFTSKLGVAFRGDYIAQDTGVLGPAVRPGAGIVSADPNGDLASLTLTLNYKPVPSLKIQPEVRFDTTSYTGGLDGKKSRVIVGAGMTYSF